MQLSEGKLPEELADALQEKQRGNFLESSLVSNNKNEAGFSKRTSDLRNFWDLFTITEEEGKN